MLCNNATLQDSGAVGDPLEIALLQGAAREELSRPEILREHPELQEVAFDSETRRMATGDQASTAVAVARAIGLSDDIRVMEGRSLKTAESLSEEETSGPYYIQQRWLGIIPAWVNV